MIRRCVSGPETRTILDQCHHGRCSGHYGPNTTAKKVPDSGFYCPSIVNEAHTLVRLCEACQKTGNISKRGEMLLHSIQPKLRSRWLGPYVVKHQYPSGYVELCGKDGKTFIVNDHRLKLYHEEDNDPREELPSFLKNEP
ncbi:reverse transcriptase domain-containing protein [Tanacetum coccineum]